VGGTRGVGQETKELTNSLDWRQRRTCEIYQRRSKSKRASDSGRLRSRLPPSKSRHASWCFEPQSKHLKRKLTAWIYTVYTFPSSRKFTIPNKQTYLGSPNLRPYNPIGADKDSALTAIWAIGEGNTRFLRIKFQRFERSVQSRYMYDVMCLICYSSRSQFEL
jgi:hypothetical protein